MLSIHSRLRGVFTVYSSIYVYIDLTLVLYSSLKVGYNGQWVYIRVSGIYSSIVKSLVYIRV